MGCCSSSSQANDDVAGGDGKESGKSLSIALTTSIINQEKEKEYVIPSGQCKLCESELNEQCITCEIGEKDVTVDPCVAIEGGCNHSFHLHCIQTWLKKHYKCPYEHECASDKWYFYAVDNVTSKKSNAATKENETKTNDTPIQTEKETEKEKEKEKEKTKDNDNENDNDSDSDSDSSENKNDKNENKNENDEKEKEELRIYKENNCLLCNNALNNQCILCEKHGNQQECVTRDSDCGHTFHHHCIVRWLNSAANRKLYESKKEKFDGLHSLGICPIDNKMFINKYDQYTVYVICGPSGVGKGTLLRELHKKLPNIFEIAVSSTTREARNGETDGKDYHFVESIEKFEEMIKNNEFLEYAKVHNLNYYGTSKNSIANIVNGEKLCVLEIDMNGAKSVKKNEFYNFNGNTRYIFVSTHDTRDENEIIGKLRERLKNRNSESAEEIDKRMETAKKEIAFMKEWEKLGYWDYIEYNDDVDDATDRLKDKLIEWHPWISERINTFARRRY